MSRLHEIRSRKIEIQNALKAFDPAVAEALTDEQRAEFQGLVDEFKTIDTEGAPLEARQAQVDAILNATVPVARETTHDNTPVRSVNVSRNDDPFTVLENRGAGLSSKEYERALVDGIMRAQEHQIEDGGNQVHFERLLKRHGSDLRWAENILARSRPEYMTGWSKLVMGRPELMTNEERTALSVGTSANGGYLVPANLDPTLILTSNGSSNVIRQLARKVTLTEGNQWKGATTAGVSASFDGELAEVSDDTPTVGQPTVTVYKAQALVQASIESTEDIPGLASDILMLFADARDVLEGSKFATGSGTNEPWGIFAALDANTNVEVTSATAATIALADLHGLYAAVPQRFRGKGTWLMNPTYALAIKALGTAVSASFSNDITMAPTGLLLGKPLVESDDAPVTQTTTVRDNEIVYGDFSNYVIADKPGSTSVEYIPHLFNTTTNLPDGRRGWYMHWRTGADSVNDLAFRLLQDKTSA
jgi:HK97 family phage major capsid protein